MLAPAPLLVAPPVVAKEEHTSKYMGSSIMAERNSGREAERSRCDVADGERDPELALDG